MCKRILNVALMLLVLSGIGVVHAAPDSELIPFWNDYEAQSAMNVDHSAWGGILETYVDDQHPSGINRFDYEAMTSGDKLAIENYLDYLQQFEPRQLNLMQQKAYWLNFYNAAVVNRVLNNYPLDSTRRLNWRARSYEVVMQRISLNVIEHGILRPIFKDPRVLFALNAGNLGSGDLQKTPFTEDNTEQLLEKITSQFLNHPRGARVDDGVLTVSKIFQWYIDDFGGTKANVREYVRRYANDDLKIAIDRTRGARYSYDWSLNQAGN